MNSSKKPHKWRKREAALGLILKQEKFNKLFFRARELAQIFFHRKSLRLILCDTYLEKLWRVSRRTVQRTLAKLEELGLLARHTDKPRRSGECYTQKRVLVLKLPSLSEIRKIVCHFGLPDNFLLKKKEKKTQPATKAGEGKQQAFVDYLGTRENVPLKAWMFWMRKWGAKGESFGYLRKIHKQIANRADLVESILFDAQREKLQGKKLVGFLVKQIGERLHQPVEPITNSFKEQMAGAEKIKRELGLI